METLVSALSRALAPHPIPHSSSYRQVMEGDATWTCLACTYINEASTSPESCAICGRFNAEFLTQHASSKEQQQSIQIPKDYLCPITQDIMTDPVIAADGYTYERSAIKKWIKKRGNSPLTREPLEKDQLFPNRLLKKQIEEFVTRQRWVQKKSEIGLALCSIEASEVREFVRKKEKEMEPERDELKRKINVIVDRIMNLEVEKEELVERLKEIETEEKEERKHIAEKLGVFNKELEAIHAEQSLAGIMDPKVVEMIGLVNFLNEKIGVPTSTAKN